MSGRDAEKQLIQLLTGRIRDRGWRDPNDMALQMAQALIESPALLDDEVAFVKLVPDQFELTNRATSGQLFEALKSVRSSISQLIDQAVISRLPPIIMMDDIDSFVKARSIHAADISSWTTPLDLPEDDIERMVAKIAGQPYLQKDWGGEMDDMFSSQVRLGGRAVATSFLFKGHGVKTRMKPKDLGKNADQITRLTSQPAELFVVQHVHGVDASVRQQLENAVVAKRARGQAAVGSIWEGVDIGRLGVAYGFLDPANGTLLPGRLEQS